MLTRKGSDGLSYWWHQDFLLDFPFETCVYWVHCSSLCMSISEKFIFHFQLFLGSETSSSNNHVFKIFKIIFFKTILFCYHFVRLFYFELGSLTEVLRWFKSYSRHVEGLRWWELWQCYWHWLGIFCRSTIQQK